MRRFGRSLGCSEMARSRDCRTGSSSSDSSNSRNEAAFEALLIRHGPMVLSVCRRLLRDPSDADDAFQAVFLVLVRKARSIRVDGSLGPWLYTVASRVASRARANRRRMRQREVGAVEGLDAPAGRRPARSLRDSRRDP